ncbi:MAG: lysophospholipid acyltransferase family protein [Pseudomonadota bacterium]
MNGSSGDAERHQPRRTGGGRRFLAVAARSCAYLVVLVAFLVGAALFYCYTRVRTVALDPVVSRRVTRSVIHRGISLLFRVLEGVGLLHVVEEQDSGPHCNGQSGVIVANHPSMLDALFFLSRVPQVVCVMKAALLKLPVLGGFARAAGYLPYNETPELWERAKAARDEGACILIFPEGTRSPPSGLGEFKRGAARIATELGVPLWPYVLEMKPIVLSRERPWWSPPAETVVLRVKRLPILVSKLPNLDAETGHPPDDNRRESVRLTESLEVLINSSLSSSQAPK